MKVEERLQRAIGKDMLGDIEPHATPEIAREAIALLRDSSYCMDQNGYAIYHNDCENKECPVKRFLDGEEERK